MKTILYINHVSHISGAEKSLLDMISVIDREKYLPLVACPSGMLEEKVKALDVQWIPIQLGRMKKTKNPIRLYKYLFNVINSIKVLKQKSVIRNIDLIHCNSIVSILVGSKLGRVLGVPVLWHVRDWPRQKWYWHWFMKRSKKMIAVSKAIATQINCPEKTVVLYNGFNEVRTIFSSKIDKYKKKLGIFPNDSVIGIFGQLVPWKGHRDFIEIAEKVSGQVKNVKFLIVGSDLFNDHNQYVEALKNHVKQKQLDDRILFCGYKKDIENWMSMTDIIVSCSTNEPFGRTLVEAMLMKKAVVAYNSGAHSEIVSLNPKTGKLIDYRNVADFAEALITLLEDRSLRQEFGKNACQWAERHFSLDQLKHNLHNLYENELENRN